MAGAGAAAAVAVLLGVMPALLPLNATLGLGALLLLAVAMAATWRLLRSYAARTSALPAMSWSQTNSDEQAATKAGLRGDTVLFYLGAATAFEVRWRPGGLTLSDIFFVCSLLWCCLSALSRRSPIERLPTLLIAGTCLFAVGGTAGAIGSAAHGQSLYEVVRSVWAMLLWPWTAAMVLRTRRDVLVAMVIWLVSGSLDGLAALGQVTGLSALAGHVDGHRATGFAPSANDLGGAAGTLLVPALALALRFRARGPVVRISLWVGVLLTVASLATSGSLSGISGGLVALFVWIVSPDLRRATRVAAVLGLAGVVVLTSILGSSVPSPVHRVQDVFARPGSSPTAGSAQAHLDTITFAWPRIRSDPLVGAGLDRANLLVHSSPVAAWYGGGILALVGFLLIFGSVFAFGWWAALAAPNNADRMIAWALACAVLAFFVFLGNQPLFLEPYGFLASALTVAWGRRVIEARAPVRLRHAQARAAGRAPAVLA